MTSNLILENFDAFKQDNYELFEEAETTMSLVRDDMYYDSYTSKLLEGIEESESKLIRGMMDRQRTVLLEESSSLMASPEAVSYAVASFPMLVDIYSDPLLSKIVSVYPSNKPTLTIPRLKWVSKIIDEKGNVEELEFPTASKMVRPGYKQIELPGAGNLFTVIGVEKSGFRLNKRNFKITKLLVNVDGSSDDVEVELVAVADARGNFHCEDVTVPGADGSIFKLQGSLNFESGDIAWSLIPIIDGGTAVVAKLVTAKLRIFGVGNGKAVVKSRPKQDVLDINCDIEDSFEIENIEEVIQDWKSLYELDIIAQIKQFVKDQIKLNRDWEVADLLESNIPVNKKYGHHREIDLSSFPDDTNTRPTTVVDVFKNLLPVITALIEKIRKTTRMEVSYIVTGVDSAAVLKSMQEYALKFEKYEGSTSQKGTTGDFNKLEIISSQAISDDMIYLITKSEALSQSSIVEVSHKPLYIIQETTDSIKRFFIKSRNWIGIVRNESLGSIKIKGYKTFLAIAQ